MEGRGGLEEALDQVYQVVELVAQVQEVKAIMVEPLTQVEMVVAVEGLRL